jgi:hypothetical protein
MNIREKTIQLIKEEINKNDLKLVWYTTKCYHQKITSIEKVNKDIEREVYTIRNFFKKDIRNITAIEVHREGILKGGFHTHTLWEGIPDEVWKYRSPQLDTFLLEIDPAINRACNDGYSPTLKQQGELLDKVFRSFNRSIPTGRNGLNIKTIDPDEGGVSGLVQYITKDIEDLNRSPGEVIDWKNSKALRVSAPKDQPDKHHQIQHTNHNRRRDRFRDFIF